MIFARENFGSMYREGMPLFQAHWQETEMYRAGHEFNLDLPRYIKYSEDGFYQMFTARDNGKLVGDAGMYVTVGMHDRRKMAMEDTWYLLPEYRKGRNAINFLKFVEQNLKEQGCQEVYMTTKLENGAGRILEFCGYKHIANQYWKEL